MNQIKPQLIIFGTDSTQLDLVKPQLTILPYVSYEVGTGPQVTKKTQLDAMWVTLMEGMDKFGLNPPFPLHEARVYRTPAPELERGFPRYGVVGVATSKEDPKDPEYNLRLVLSALLKAIKEFNSQSPDKIGRVGILPEDLDLKRMKPEAAFSIIREIYEGQ